MGFSRQLKKPGLRRSSNCVQNAFFELSPSGRNEKHPWDRILQFLFHATILGRLFQAAEKAGFTKVVQLRSTRVFSPFPIGAKRGNTLGIEFYNFGFMPPFWVGFSKERKKPGLRRSSNCVQNGFFFKFSHRGETKKHPWDRILQFRFHATIFGGLFEAGQKAGLTKVVQLRSKRVFSTFPICAKRKNTLGSEFYNLGFMPPFWVVFSKQRKKPGSRRSSNCVQNAFFQTFPIGEKRKNTLGIEFYNFGFMPPFWVGFSKQRKKPGSRRSSNCVQNAFFHNFPIGEKRKNTLGIEFYNFGFMPPFWVGFSKQRRKPG